MGGEANMFRTSIVPPPSEGIPVSGMMACSRHAELFSKLVSVEFHSIEETMRAMLLYAKNV